jgi:RNA polymerase sigma factor (sigma-70 family)
LLIILAYYREYFFCTKILTKDTNDIDLEKEFLQTILENQGIIHKVCNVYCDVEEDRNDLFQEIIAQLWKAYPSFRNESKLTTWMFKVGLNTAITFFKKNKRRPDQDELAFDSYLIADENAEPETEEKIKLLLQAVARLTGIEKSIILLFLENKSYEEIAEITGITQNYVRVKMNRIKKKLRRLMGNGE